MVLTSGGCSASIIERSIGSPDWLGLGVERQIFAPRPGLDLGQEAVALVEIAGFPPLCELSRQRRIEAARTASRASPQPI